ncbi:hypothetical protein VBD025_13625 [Virgibacillus flavescens]|uniref:hypothetical protein n=1 Tax=Virgibacillus flavescens TaxID=1611422 RepID=UPI003D34E4F5
MENIVKYINSFLIENGLPSTIEISPKTLRRLVNFEQYARNIEKLNVDSLMEIKRRRMTKVSISSSPELNISRKTLYNDKIFLKYAEARMDNQIDYLNENKLIKVKEQYLNLKSQYNKVIDHLLDTSILQAEIIEYKERIQELIQDKNRLHTLLKKYENRKL